MQIKAFEYAKSILICYSNKNKIYFIPYIFYLKFFLICNL